MNQKPIQNHVFEADPEELRRMREEFNEKNSDDDEEDIPDERFYEARSSASCKIEDITGVIYGGVSSRFWLSRK